jgi:hypothetical protein
MGGRVRRLRRTGTVRQQWIRRIDRGGLLGGERDTGSLPALEVLDGIDRCVADVGEASDRTPHDE